MKKTFKGWTCTCVRKEMGELLKPHILFKRKKDVLCNDEYWNHNPEGKPVKCRITIKVE